MVAWHVRAPATRLSLGVPQAGIDVRALAEIRQQLGHATFIEAAREHLDPDNLTNLMSLLDEQDQQP